VANSFRTTAGRCLVVDGTITLDSDGGGWLGTLREGLTSDAIPVWRRAAVVLFYVAAVAAIAFAVQNLPVWVTGVAIGLLLVALVRSWRADRGRRSDDEEEIAVEDVVGVDPHPGIPLFTRARFVLRYRAEGGVKHRYIQCPSRIYGFDSFRTGLDIFERHGILASEETVERETATAKL
jgi:hypothetical protein